MAQLLHHYPGVSIADWYDMRVRDIARFLEQMQAMQAREAIQQVNAYAVARALGYKESSSQAQRIVADWETVARAGQPQLELSEAEKAKRAKFDLFRASVMGLEI